MLYIRPFNTKKAIALADSKLKTKAYLAARGIPVAKLYGRIEHRDQLWNFDFGQLPDECVLKPNQGFGGEGILVLKGRDKSGRFLRNGNVPMDEQELREHIEDILDGKFSLKGMLDTAFFEQILKPHECFERFRPLGLPDIRVIVFNLVPVMAMLRIPTADSDGKANIHLGGIGIGIDIAKGVTTHAAQYHKMITVLPHGESPAGHKIPYWDDILLVCSRIQQLTNIGYLAVDITIDAQMGPALLEVNARAGLMVQVANLAPLGARLERVKGLKVDSPEKGVRIGQDLFGSKTKKKETSKETPKPTLGLQELIEITLEDGSAMEITAAVSGGQERTMFSTTLIAELTKKKGVQADETQGLFRVKFMLGGKKIQTLVEQGDTAAHRAIIGARDLSGFLIDPTKKLVKSDKKPIVQKTDLRALDRMYGQIDRDLQLLRFIKPLNLIEELKRLQSDELYNPIFVYPTIDADLDEVRKRLREKIEDESPLGMLLEKKRKELLLRRELLHARGNESAFTKASYALFGEPTQELINAAREALDLRLACDLAPPLKRMLNATQAQKAFEEILKSYALYDWKVKIREKLVARMTVGGNSIFIRSDAIFTKEHIASLIAHEIETHVLTSENGGHQPYEILRRGCAGYLDTQEGLAIQNERGIVGPHAEKRFSPEKNVLGLAFSLEHSLAQTRAYLQNELGLSMAKAIQQSVAMKRGMGDTSQPGGFTKSLVYFRGYKRIVTFLANGGDLRRLYIGKVTLEDLECIEKLPNIKPPLILPEFLREG